MRKFVLIVMFLAASALADAYVDSVFAGPKHTSTPEEIAAASVTETKCVSDDDRGLPVRFFAEIGLLDLGFGLRFYVGETWHNYMQFSIQYDWVVVRIPTVWHVGGEHFHFIVGVSANVAALNGAPFSTAFITVLNYDINRHVGFNLELLLSAPTTIVFDAQFAF